MAKLADFITTAPGFRAAVRLVDELDDFEKAAAYIPTKGGADVLFDVGRQLEPTARQRARLITGSYGTGKSHLALVLGAMYRGYADRVAPVIERLGQASPGRLDTLKEALRQITPERNYLLVVLEGDQDDFDAAMVRSLRAALDAAGWADYMPQTYFSAAAERLEELMSLDDAHERSERVMGKTWRREVARLVDELRAGTHDALERFDDVHRRVCFGAPFSYETRIKAAETFRECAERLVDSGRCLGIVVIWDEFGSFMDQVVREPGARTGLAVQQFAEVCNNSQQNQLHLYLIAHRTLPSYVARFKDAAHLTRSQEEAWNQDWQKISGRFKEWVLESQPDEMLALIDNALIQRSGDGWQELAANHEQQLEELTELTYRTELFENLPYNQVRKAVVEGCYPLHPVTTAILMHVSRIVAQNQRTLFTFLCGDHPGTVAEFLRETEAPPPGQPLPLIPADRLWDYFEQAIREERIVQDAYRRYRNAGSVTAGMGDMERRLVKVLALFEVLRCGYSGELGRLLPTDEVLRAALSLQTPEERNQLEAVLSRLSSPGTERVVFRTARGDYRLISSGAQDLGQLVEDKMRERETVFRPGRFLRDRWSVPGGSDLGAGFGWAGEVTALESPDYRVVPRAVKVFPILVEELDNLDEWTQHLGSGHYYEGLLFITLPGEDLELGAVGKPALAWADNPQVIVARPKTALRGLRTLAAKLDALEDMAREEPQIWGASGERKDEWQEEYQATLEDLRQVLQPVAVHPYASRLDLVCYWQGEQTGVSSWGELNALCDRAMQVAYHKTPKTKDQLFRDERLQRGLGQAVSAVIGMMLAKDGAARLLGETDQARARISRILEQVGVLRRNPRPSFVRPSEKHDPGAAAAWDEIIAFVKEARETAQVLETLVKLLRAAPYGISARAQALLFTAATREELMNGNLRLLCQRQRRGQDDWEPQDTTAETIVAAFQRPESYVVHYVRVTDQQYLVVEGLLDALGGTQVMPDNRLELLRCAKEHVARWWAKLPSYCRNTRMLSPRALWLRDEILRELVLPGCDEHEVLIRRMGEKIKARPGTDRSEATRTFGAWVAEIESAVERLRKDTAHSLLGTLGLDGEPTPEGVFRALRKWYEALPQLTRQYAHRGDAGRLQQALEGETNPGDFLDSLSRSFFGKTMSDWSDEDAGVFMGRIQGAKTALEEWTAPVPPPDRPDTSPPVASGMAYLSLVADVAGRPLRVERFFPTMPLDQFSETGKMVLRLIQRNYLEDQTMQDGERENILVEVIRRLFGDAHDNDNS